MVAKGASLLPNTWWFSLFPGFAILLIVLGFNLVGDGLKDMFDVDV